VAFVYAKANVEFKAKYGKYVRNASWLAVVFHALVFILSPPITFEPYELKGEKFELVEVPQDIELLPLKEVEMPRMNVEATSAEEEGEEASFPETTFNDVSDMPPPPPPPSDSGDAGGVFLAFDEPPVLIDYVTPEYPLLDRAAGYEGTVRVRVLVGADGKVLGADVLSSDASPEMQQAAIAAAMKCKFKPARQRTTPVKSHVMIPFLFQLD
jgi:protein TonB